MFDDIKLNTNNMVNENRRSIPQRPPKIIFVQPYDEFVRNMRADVEKSKYSKEDIGNVFSNFDYGTILKDLTQENCCFLSGCSIGINYNDSEDSCITVKVENLAENKDEVFKLSVNELKELLKQLKANAEEKYPEKAEEYNTLYTQLIEKMQAKRNIQET